MWDFIDRATASDVDRARAEYWADFALARFGGDAAQELRRGIDGPVRVKSRKALRMAIRRVEAKLSHQIAIATI